MSTYVIKSTKEMTGKGSDQIGSKSALGPMAREHVIVGSAAGFIWMLMPGSICTWEKALNCSRTTGPGECLECFGVKVVDCPRWCRRAGF